MSLVAEGLTNPQIADQLTVSRRTVSTHLYRIFKKVGVPWRAEVVAATVRREQIEASAPEGANPSFPDEKYVS